MKGPRTPAATPEYRDGWTRAFEKPAKKRRPKKAQERHPHAKPRRPR